LIHDDEHEISALNTCLEAEAALGQFHEDRRSPRLRMFATHHAGAMFAADDESGFLQIRDDDDALRLVPDGFRNAFVRGVPDLRQHGGGFVELFDVAFL
jgi:hypothetical protein